MDIAGVVVCFGFVALMLVWAASTSFLLFGIMAIALLLFVALMFVLVPLTVRRNRRRASRVLADSTPNATVINAGWMPIFNEYPFPAGSDLRRKLNGRGATALRLVLEDERISVWRQSPPQSLGSIPWSQLHSLSLQRQALAAGSRTVNVLIMSIDPAGTVFTPEVELMAPESPDDLGALLTIAASHGTHVASTV